MPKSIDETGNVYGQWTVICRVRGPYPGVHWLCRCECGCERYVYGRNLRSGRSKSCGECGNHGMCQHPSYNSWRAMKERCFNSNNIAFDRYGGRGISVCPEWESFDGFWRDMGPTYQDGLTLDRIDNEGDYEPANCRWATRKQQANNRAEFRPPTAKLTDAEVMAIRAHAGWFQKKQLAEWFGVDPSSVSRIISGHLYRGVANSG